MGGLQVGAKGRYCRWAIDNCRWVSWVGMGAVARWQWGDCKFSSCDYGAVRYQEF